MKKFKYKAFDSSGAIASGELSALNMQSATQALKADKLKPISIVEDADNAKFNFSRPDKVTADDLEFVTAELNLLLNSGVKIDKALAVLASAKSGSALAELLMDLSVNVRKGLSLSVAMENHIDVFDKQYINLVKIGESSGNLSLVFSGLAQDLKHKKELRNKIIQAIAYPSVILMVCILSILFIFNFVVPKLTVMFADAVELPLYTQILLAVSDAIQNYQVHAGILIVLGVFVFRTTMKKGLWAHRFDEYMLQLPVLSQSVLLVERVRYTSSMSLMLYSGVKIDQALLLSAGSIKNRVIANKLTGINDKVRKGEAISTSLRQSGLFPDLFVSLLEVGEESGKMAPVFEEIATRSRNQFSTWTDRVTSLLEPIMILVMGGIVGSVVVVMLMSIVSVNDIGI